MSIADFIAALSLKAEPIQEKSLVEVISYYLMHYLGFTQKIEIMQKANLDEYQFHVNFSAFNPKNVSKVGLLHGVSALRFVFKAPMTKADLQPILTKLLVKNLHSTITVNV